MGDWKKLFDSAVSQVGEGAKAATEGVRGVADDARKVVGIGVGDLAIKVHFRAYLGGRVKGTLSLSLPEPIPAERLSIALRAQRSRIPVENLRKRGASGLQTEDVYDFAVDLDGSRTYETGEYEFSIDIPNEAPEPATVPGFLGDALKAARALQSMTEGELRWRLVATLHIPWKRNLTKTVGLVVRAASERPAPTPTAAPKPKPRPPPPIPHPVSLPAGWGEALHACLKQIQRNGGVIIHQFIAPAVQPSVVAEVLQRAPDLPHDILIWYGLMDGLELVVGVPREVKSDYDSVRLARAAAAKYQGAIGCLGELGGGDLGATLEEEFGIDHEGGYAVLEIPNLARMLDADNEDFSHRDGKSVVFGRVTVEYGEYFGLTRSEEIRRWRQPSGSSPGRDGYFDYAADAYQAVLKRRGRDCDDAWWVVRGEDHGGLALPPQLLRWSEMLTWSLEHLVRAVPPAKAR